MTPTTVAFDLNETADVNEAGTSRYGDYLAHHQHLFRDADAPTTDPAVFALMAWRVAEPPVMAPGYLRAHPRVLSTTDAWDEQDNRAGLLVHLALPTTALAQRLTRGTGWFLDRYAARWGDWRDTSRASMQATLTAMIPISWELLPDPRYHLGVPDTATAKAALRVLCALLNAELAGVLAVLDGVTVA